jgi:hypothetical protein
MLSCCQLTRPIALDPDVAEHLKALAHRRNVSFKAALNGTVRAGLAVERGGGRPYHTPARPMRLRPGIDLTHALRLAAPLEDDRSKTAMAGGMLVAKVPPRGKAPTRRPRHKRIPGTTQLPLPA